MFLSTAETDRLSKEMERETGLEPAAYWFEACRGREFTERYWASPGQTTGRYRGWLLAR
jgi:hypothetical protein